MTHTPGPWRVSTNGFHVVAGHFEFLPATKDGAIPEEWGANARLIAAAPTMLQALHILARDLDNIATHPNDKNVDAWARMAARDARAAIAKAEGEGQ